MFTDDTVSRFSTAATIPPMNMDSDEPEPATADPLDDVFGDDSDDERPSLRQHRDPDSRRGERTDEVSDVPRLQGIHTTNGYRDGIAASKEKFLQEGFDEGYSLGAEFGAAAGKIVGVLESLVLAVQGDAEHQKGREEIAKLLAEAKDELSAKKLYAEEYFGQDGIWKYGVMSQDGSSSEENVTFRVVANNHPLIMKWTSAVNGLLERYGLAEKVP